MALKIIITYVQANTRVETSVHGDPKEGDAAVVHPTVSHTDTQ